MPVTAISAAPSRPGPPSFLCGTILVVRCRSVPWSVPWHSIGVRVRARVCVCVVWVKAGLGPAVLLPEAALAVGAAQAAAAAAASGGLREADETHTWGPPQLIE